MCVCMYTQPKKVTFFKLDIMMSVEVESRRDILRYWFLQNLFLVEIKGNGDVQKKTVVRKIPDEYDTQELQLDWKRYYVEYNMCNTEIIHKNEQWTSNNSSKYGFYTTHL